MAIRSWRKSLAPGPRHGWAPAGFFMATTLRQTASECWVFLPPRMPRRRSSCACCLTWTASCAGGPRRAASKPMMRFDTDTAIGGPDGHFPSTQLSLLETAGGGLPNEALERVIALYWKPVYRFIRLKFGKDNEDAKDLT